MPVCVCVFLIVTNTHMKVKIVSTHNIIGASKTYSLGSYMCVCVRLSWGGNHVLIKYNHFLCKLSLLMFTSKKQASKRRIAIRIHIRWLGDDLVVSCDFKQFD